MCKIFVLLTDEEIDVAPVWELRDEVRRLTVEIKRLRGEAAVQKSEQRMSLGTCESCENAPATMHVCYDCFVSD